MSWFKSPAELMSRNEPFSFQKHLMSFSIARRFSLRSAQIKWTGFDEILHKGSLCQDASKTLVKKMGVADPIFPKNELSKRPASRWMYAFLQQLAGFCLSKSVFWLFFIIFFLY